MESNQFSAKQESGEITLKSLVVSIRSYGREFRMKWKIAAVFCLMAIGYQSVQYFRTETTYSGHLTFMINEDQVQQMPAVTGVLGQFGLSSISSDYNLDKIIQLLRSRRITQSVLFSEHKIHGRQDLLANHLIHHLDSTRQWMNPNFYQRLRATDPLTEEKKTFRFTSNSPDFKNTLENSIIKDLHDILIADNSKSKESFLQADYSESSGIMNISVRTSSPDLSIALAKEYFDQLSDFYIEKTIEKQERTYQIIRTKHDSIFQELRSAEFDLANFKDRNKETFSYTSQLDETRLRNKITILTAGLAESTKNMEMADFALQNKTPFIQLIDFPIHPLDADPKSFLESLATSIIFALILSGILIFFGKIVSEALQSP